MKITSVTYRQQAQPRQFESVSMEATAELEPGESYEIAAAALAARVRRRLAAELVVARLPESSWLAEGDMEDLAEA